MNSEILKSWVERVITETLIHENIRTLVRAEFKNWHHYKKIGKIDALVKKIGILAHDVEEFTDAIKAIIPDDESLLPVTAPYRRATVDELRKFVDEVRVRESEDNNE